MHAGSNVFSIGSASTSHPSIPGSLELVRFRQFLNTARAKSMAPQVAIFFRRRRNPLRLGLVPTLVVGVALLESGCASYTPRSLVIRPSAFQNVMRAWDSRTIDLRIVSFNVWGLPGWMNGASADRYP